jgi:Fe-S-cluster containining protein
MKQLPVIESCDGCGACCMQQGHPPYTDEERQYVPYELLSPIDEYVASFEGEDDTGRPCIWLDLATRSCLHYDHRPQVCRDFERGSDECRVVRWRYRIQDNR